MGRKFQQNNKIQFDTKFLSFLPSLLSCLFVFDCSNTHFSFLFLTFQRYPELFLVCFQVFFSFSFALFKYNAQDHKLKYIISLREQNSLNIRYANGRNIEVILK